jgi:type 1 glutamine amidotransferase
MSKDVKVLITLDPANYPLGKKDVIRDGDIPVVWTNTKYKMLYLNMGHGDHIFTTACKINCSRMPLCGLGTRR